MTSSRREFISKVPAGAALTLGVGSGAIGLDSLFSPAGGATASVAAVALTKSDSIYDDAMDQYISFGFESSGGENRAYVYNQNGASILETNCDTSLPYSEDVDGFNDLKLVNLSNETVLSTSDMGLITDGDERRLGEGSTLPVSFTSNGTKGFLGDEEFKPDAIADLDFGTYRDMSGEVLGDILQIKRFGEWRRYTIPVTNEHRADIKKAAEGTLRAFDFTWQTYFTSIALTATAGLFITKAASWYAGVEGLITAATGSFYALALVVVVGGLACVTSYFLVHHRFSNLKSILDQSGIGHTVIDS